MSSLAAMVRALPGDGVALSGNDIVRYEDGQAVRVLGRDEIRLRGEHNVENVLSAIAIASQLGVSDAAAAEAIRGFTGVAHRLEAVSDGRFVNDHPTTLRPKPPLQESPSKTRFGRCCASP